MTQRLLTLLLCLVLTSTALPLRAEEGLTLDIERIRDRSDVQIDPVGAYILVETDLFANIEFVKKASPAERQAWEAQRLDALAQADKQADGEAQDAGNFPWPAAESQLRLRMDVNGHFERKRDFVLYLYRVPPGTYTFYAHNTYNTQDCACMGTVSFPVTAGSITALRVEREYLGADGEVLTERPKKGTALERLMRTGIAVSAPTALSYDERLPQKAIQAATFTPEPEVPNWGRYIINRVLPIKGLFSYDRDHMIIESPDSDQK